MPNFNSVTRRSYCIYRRGNQKRKIHQHKTAKGFSSVSAFLAVLTVFVVVTYLFSANEVSIKGDKIYKLEKDIKKLTRENEYLVIQEAQLRSLESVENIIKNKNMEEVVEPIYIDQETRVALDK